MAKHRAKIIAAVVIAAALVLAWFYDGHLAPHGDGDITAPVLAAELPAADSEFTDEDPAEQAPALLHIPYETTGDDRQNADIADAPPAADDEPGMEDAGRCGVPAGYALQPADEDSFYVTLTVRVDAVLDNMHLLNSDLHALIPADGAIFPAAHVRAYDGENVFDVLQREMRHAGIHMASRTTPIYSAAYVEAIGNLHEFDAGPLSGWRYSVNGDFPNFSASRYILSPGYIIEWLYILE